MTDHPDAARLLIVEMIQRCVDRSCEGDDIDMLNSGEQCRNFFGIERINDWCDMCLLNDAIKAMKGEQ